MTADNPQMPENDSSSPMRDLTPSEIEYVRRDNARALRKIGEIMKKDPFFAKERLSGRPERRRV